MGRNCGRFIESNLLVVPENVFTGIAAEAHEGLERIKADN